VVVLVAGVVVLVLVDVARATPVAFVVVVDAEVVVFVLLLVIKNTMLVEVFVVV
jgi:hypothetical protein